MKPNNDFIKLGKDFWANIKTISQEVGYTVRKGNQIKIPTIDEILNAYQTLGLNSLLIFSNNALTDYGEKLISYFKFRADLLNNYVKGLLLDAPEAKFIYEKLFNVYKPQSPQPMNKQKGEKKARAYFTCLINMFIENKLHGLPCDYDPRELTTITKNKFPLRTLSRRVDGAFPSAVNPIAVWEIKEYYYTTTFGSRVADGVYETLLDGMELEEIYKNENINILHYLFIDSYNTWWNDGKAYLCRIIDMLHMGYVDEVLFGKEVIDSLSEIVDNWVEIFEKQR
jgi:hypothetical protein